MIQKINENNNIFEDNIAYIHEYDFSKANSSHESRLNAVTSIASVCYASPDIIGSQGLYNRLANEDIGIPSSSFAFIPVLLDESSCDLLASYNASGTDDTEKFGEVITYNNRKYLLTNLRALLQDLGWTTDFKLAQKLSEDFFNTDVLEQAIIKKFYKVYKVHIDIATSKQWNRHNYHLQELCVAGDTLLLTSQGKRTIKEAYDIQESHKNFDKHKFPKVKSYDFDSNRFFKAPIKEIFKTGKKEVFEVTIQIGTIGKTYKIKTSNEHKFLTKNGWKRLKELSVKDFVAVNGKNIWQDYEWCKKTKEEYLKNKKGMKSIAEEEGINYNTLKKWFHIHGLQYTQLEKSSTFTVWNKGITGEESHAFGKIHSDESRQKISNKHTMELGTTKQGFAKRMRSYWEADFRRSKILNKYENKCIKCSSNENLELDHINPVYAYPELGFEESNVQILCKKCHEIKTKQEGLDARQCPNYGMIISIESVGEEETYDLEVDHKDHNYIANGIIVHNSRRYVSGKKVPFEFYIDEKMERVNSFQSLNLETQSGNSVETKIELYTEDVIDICVNHYYKALEQGVAPQNARRILPQGAYTEIWTGMTPRVYDNMLKLRTKPKTQWEFRQLALQIAEWDNWKEQWQ